jgi:hypothetical protein
MCLLVLETVNKTHINHTSARVRHPFVIWRGSTRSLLRPRRSCFCVRFPWQLQESRVTNNPFSALCLHDPWQTHHNWEYAPEQNYTTLRKARNPKGIYIFITCRIDTLVVSGMLLQCGYGYGVNWIQFISVQSFCNCMPAQRSGG